MCVCMCVCLRAFVLGNGASKSSCVFVQVMVLITGAHKALALSKAIEEGVSHMWTVSAFQMHRNLFICDEPATMKLRVKTVKYFKGLMDLHNLAVQD